MRARAIALLAVGVLGAGAAPAGAAPAGCLPDFRRELDPIPLADGTGFVEHAWYGGWQNPRPQLLDLDADGDLDLLVLEEDGQLRFYRNTGGPTAPVWSLETDDYAGVHERYFARAVDIDADGDQDLLVEAPSFAITIDQDTRIFVPGGYLYTNVGTAAAPVYRNLSTHPDGYLVQDTGEPIPISTTTPDFVDLEGDGDPDLLMGDRAGAGSIVLYRNVGTPQSAVFHFETDTYRDLSLVFGQCNPSRAFEPPLRHGFMLFSFGDVNADGRPDLFVGDSFNSNVYLWQNVGGPGPSPDFACQTETYFPGPGGGPGFFGQRILTTLGDVDGDGDVDALFGSGESSSLGLHFYRNEGTPSAPVHVLESSDWIPELDLGRDSAPVFADLDGDQDADLFLGSGSSQAVSRWNDEDGLFALYFPVWVSLPGASWTGAEFADIDADGDEDFFVGGEGGDIRWFRNVGGGPDPSDFAEVTNDPDFGEPTDRTFRSHIDSQPVPCFLDTDGDGDLDLLAGNWDTSGSASLLLFRNDGTPQAHRFVLASADFSALGPLGQGLAPEAADLDGDGDEDLLMGRLDGTIALLRNVGTPSRAAFVVEDGRFGGIDVGARAVPALADPDGDGDLDLVVGESGGGLNFYRNVAGPPPAGPSAFALQEPAADAGVNGRRAARFRWEPSLRASDGQEVGEYELRLAPTPDAPPAEWTALAVSGHETDVRLWSHGYRFRTEFWWTVVARDGCVNAPVPEWRHAIHTTPDELHAEPPGKPGGQIDVHPAPRKLTILNAYPSPSADVTTVRYGLPVDGRARVTVHDAGGRLVATLRAEATAGLHTATWDGRDAGGAAVGPGLYIVRLEQAGRVAARRVVRLR
jgi:hypothetical protein